MSPAGTGIGVPGERALADFGRVAVQQEAHLFDLIFADAPGGKIFKLRRTVAALREGGAIVVDDMDLSRHADEHLRSALAVMRHRLLQNAELVCAEMGFSSGVIVAVKRRP